MLAASARFAAVLSTRGARAGGLLRDKPFACLDVPHLAQMSLGPAFLFGTRPPVSSIT